MNTEMQHRMIGGNSIIDLNSIIGDSKDFIDSRSLFIHCYQQPPCMMWVKKTDNEKILKYVKRQYKDAIGHIYQYSEYNRQKKVLEFYRTIVLLADNCMLELAHGYCQILYTHGDYPLAESLLKELSRFKKREKKSQFSIHLISKDSYGMELKSMDIKKTRLDLDLYYEDDFAELDNTIRRRLNKKDDRGIILLHGLPGAGKTTYLRHLVGTLKKKVLFLSPAVAKNIMDPEFMDLLIDNPNSVLVIEDAENIVVDRRIDAGSSVSDLLNISDGLLADFLHIQVICTFNHPLSMVDAALMRKGRLIAQYEFGRLSAPKAQRLSAHMGFKTTISRPMTIAEIAGQGEKEFGPGQRVQVLGFRRQSERQEN